MKRFSCWFGLHKSFLVSFLPKFVRFFENHQNKIRWLFSRHKNLTLESKIWKSFCETTNTLFFDSTRLDLYIRIFREFLGNFTISNFWRCFSIFQKLGEVTFLLISTYRSRFWFHFSENSYHFWFSARLITLVIVK